MARTIPLTQGKFATVSDVDYATVSKYKWYAYVSRGAWRARRSKRIEKGKSVLVSMASEIKNATKPLMVDHKDRDALNNRRSNLRVCTFRQNCRNRSRNDLGKTSKYKGVIWRKNRKRWIVQIRAGELLANGLSRTLWIGSYRCEIDAAKAYDKAAIKYFGRFACLNFPTGQHG